MSTAVRPRGPRAVRPPQTPPLLTTASSSLGTLSWTKSESISLVRLPATFISAARTSILPLSAETDYLELLVMLFFQRAA